MASMTFGQKIFQPKPPIQGSFPLDHEGDCKKEMYEFMLCLKRENNENAKCRLEAREYLECRMRHNLMEARDLDKFGFKDLAGASKETSGQKN